jgi:hypothetical protein
MRNQTASSIPFQRKIAGFCNVRLAPLVSKRTLDNIKPYLTSLIIYRKIIYRKHPPMRMNCINWRSISDAGGLEDELTAALKKNLLPGLEAIARSIDKERTIDDDRPTPDDERRAPAARRYKSLSAPREQASPRTIPLYDIHTKLRRSLLEITGPEPPADRLKAGA